MKKSAEQPLTRAQLAKAHGVGPQMVSRWVKLGLPRRPDGLYDPKVATNWLRQNITGRDGSSPASDSLTAARGRKEAALASMRELELKTRRGELIEAADVEREWSAAIAGARERLLQMPEQICERVAVESDPRVCAELIRKEVYRALTELSKQF